MTGSCQTALCIPDIISKGYLVKVRETGSESAVRKLSSPMGGWDKAEAGKVKIIKNDGDTALLSIVIFEGKTGR